MHKKVEKFKVVPGAYELPERWRTISTLDGMLHMMVHLI